MFFRVIAATPVVALGIPASVVAASPDTPETLITGKRPDTPAASDIMDLPGSTLEGPPLDEQKTESLGETLSRLPGVQNGYFGPAAGRPEIRGFRGSRVALLIDGIPAQDASALSDDHAPPIEAFLVDRIEVVNGSAAILYGGNAIGGAVNAIDGRIPQAMPAAPFGGRMEFRAGYNSSATGLARLDGRIGKFAWHVDGLFRHAGDYRILGEPKADECRQWSTLTANLRIREACQVELGPIKWVRNPTTGRWEDGTPTDQRKIVDANPGRRNHLAHSSVRTSQVNAGGSFITDRGFLGFSVSRYDNAYGVPGFDYVTPAHPEPSPVRLSVGQTRFDLKGAIHDPLPGIAAITLRAGLVRAKNRETIDGEDKNLLRSRGENVRIEIAHKPLGPLTGVIGAQFVEDNLENSGTHFYLPDIRSREHGVFVTEKLTVGPLTLSGGLRYDQVIRNPEKTSIAAGRGLGSVYVNRRSFSLYNGSMAARLDLFDGVHLQGRYTHAERAPAVNELYAGGNHFAIMVEEQGDGRLRKERTETMEIGAGVTNSWLDLSVTAWQTRFKDFIYLGNTGMSRLFNVSEWRQGDTRFHGIEGQALFKLPAFGAGVFEARIFGDYVSGKPHFSLPADYSPFGSGPTTPQRTAEYFRKSLDGDYLPRTPVSRVGGDIRWSKGALNASVGGVWFAPQKHVVKNEAPSRDYFLLDAHLRYRLPRAAEHWEIFVDGRNLTNAEARPHNSFLRYRAPLPGRAVSIGARVSF